jgi:hypothetical protein
MKRVTAYVNTQRVYRLVEELQRLGVAEIMVTEYFRPLSQVSRMQLYCEDHDVVELRKCIRRLGSTGSLPDTDVNVSDFDPELPSRIPVGERMSRLEEPRLARMIRSLLRGVSTRLSLVFLSITISISAVGIFTHVRLLSYQKAARESSEAVLLITNAVNSIQTSHLEELLAVERLHRADEPHALRDFKRARLIVGDAITTLQESQLISGRALDPLLETEDRFQSLADGMFDVITRMSNLHDRDGSLERRKLSRSHAEIMASLDLLHRECVDLLASLEQDAGESARESDVENNNALNAIRLSLTALAIAATIITVFMWILTRRKVSQPLDILVEEARALDDGELK